MSVRDGAGSLVSGASELSALQQIQASLGTINAGSEAMQYVAYPWESCGRERLDAE